MMSNKILIVDDSSSIRHMVGLDLARVSRTLNYELLLFCTGQFGGLRPPSPLGFIDLEAKARV